MRDPCASEESEARALAREREHGYEGEKCERCNGAGRYDRDDGKGDRECGACDGTGVEPL